MQEKLLEVEGLTIEFPTKNGPKTVVKNLNFQLEQGDKLGIVGESGSGKSMTALALMCLLADSPSVDSGNHTKSMTKALRFLTSIPGKAAPLNQPKSYSHPMRTQALCEAYLISK